MAEDDSHNEPFAGQRIQAPQYFDFASVQDGRLEYDDRASAFFNSRASMVGEGVLSSAPLGSMPETPNNDQDESFASDPDPEMAEGLVREPVASYGSTDDIETPQRLGEYEETYDQPKSVKALIQQHEVRGDGLEYHVEPNVENVSEFDKPKKLKDPGPFARPTVASEMLQCESAEPLLIDAARQYENSLRSDAYMNTHHGNNCSEGASTAGANGAATSVATSATTAELNTYTANEQIDKFNKSLRSKVVPHVAPQDMTVTQHTTMPFQRANEETVASAASKATDAATATTAPEEAAAYNKSLRNYQRSHVAPMEMSLTRPTEMPFQRADQETAASAAAKAADSSAATTAPEQATAFNKSLRTYEKSQTASMEIGLTRPTGMPFQRADQETAASAAAKGASSSTSTTAPEQAATFNKTLRNYEKSSTAPMDMTLTRPSEKPFQRAYQETVASAAAKAPDTSASATAPEQATAFNKSLRSYEKSSTAPMDMVVTRHTELPFKRGNQETTASAAAKAADVSTSATAPEQATAFNKSLRSYEKSSTKAMDMTLTRPSEKPFQRADQETAASAAAKGADTSASATAPEQASAFNKSLRSYEKSSTAPMDMAVTRHTELPFKRGDQETAASAAAKGADTSTSTTAPEQAKAFSKSLRSYERSSTKGMDMEVTRQTELPFKRGAQETVASRTRRASQGMTRERSMAEVLEDHNKSRSKSLRRRTEGSAIKRLLPTMTRPSIGLTIKGTATSNQQVVSSAKAQKAIKDAKKRSRVSKVLKPTLPRTPKLMSRARSRASRGLRNITNEGS